MSHHHPLRQIQTIDYSTSTSPGRQPSNASTSSSAYSTYSNPFPPSRTSTLSSTTSSGYMGIGHKRGLSETAGMITSTISEGHTINENSPNGAYQSARQSLRSLPQAPGPSPPASKSSKPPHSRGQSVDANRGGLYDGGPYTSSTLSSAPSSALSTQSASRPQSMILSRADSMNRGTTSSYRPHSAGHHPNPSNQLSAPDLQSMQKSATSHLRTLSRLRQEGTDEDFSITSAQEVVGLHGRRRLQRTDSTRGSKGTVGFANGRISGFGERNWMDKQRQFLQAYEYLCHIGEAKEWIEDVLQQPIPPIVQLEEALRDGVTLAEIVQSLCPNRPVRIFRNPKLQYRHSDNIALFFRFLAEVELPELFRFELIDLYEKKNIPKVIYCVHALSWLLYRKGILDFRIGNLVGKLEFEHHELEEMQKGLDRAGVNMPSFSGMGASFGEEPEPEPVETEQERIDRELSETEHSVVELQTQIRGALLRLKLAHQMEALWDSEYMLTELQSRIRGEWARQISDYRLGMKRFSENLQSAARGFLIRSTQKNREQWWKGREGDVLFLQSLTRGRRARQELAAMKSEVKKEEYSLRELQAAARGLLQRRQLQGQVEETRSADNSVEAIQAAARGALVRLQISTDLHNLGQEEPIVTQLQGILRGVLLRKYLSGVDADLRVKTGLWRALQAVIRGRNAKTAFCALKKQLTAQNQSIVVVQAAFRAIEVRKEVVATQNELSGCQGSIAKAQAAIRGFTLRSQISQELDALETHTNSIAKLQGLATGSLLRWYQNDLLSGLELHAPEITALQGLARAMLLRDHVGDLLGRLDAEEELIIEVQAAARGLLVRRNFAEKKRYFKENMEKVVKIQSFVRGRQQGEAYKSLTSGKNPPVGTIKGFVHLLNDSDFDFDEEIEFERLRKTVVQHVRQNEMAEQYIDQLDIKIALLVKNKITLDEVVKHQKHFGGHVGNLLTSADMSSKDPFDLKALNKNSRRKLEHYQQLFFILQTQPQYLARLFKRIREQGTGEKDCKQIENLMMGLFGYAQKRREEYYLLKLIARSVREEVDGCESIQDYLRGHFFWGKLLNGYIRSPRDRKFLRDLLSPLVKENILDNPELDLESDPMQIYRAAINNEELRTGRQSQRVPDIAREQAIRDPETRETFIHHLQDLRDIADQFLAALEELMHKVPYGLRYLAQQMYESLSAHFPYENPQHILQIVGHWVWKSYLQPALTQPETWGVVERALAPLQKRNLGEVAKVLGQIAAGRLFGGDNVYLQPLNSYVGESIERLEVIWGNLISVQDAEAQFDIDEFNDLYARTKPTLYIKMADIFAIHQLIAADIAYICPSRDDVLREIVTELGSANNNKEEMMGINSNEVRLTLNPKLHDVEDPEAEVKALFMETKRCILYIIRIQSGPNLMDILVKPISMEDEERWAELLQEELLSDQGKRRGAYSEATTLVDISAMSYAELKRTALENILRLEQFGRLTRHNQYQDLLNAIAVDIRTKHRRRIQRQRELEGVKLTLGNLNEKALWLESQLKSYNDYIEQAMITLQNKKGKKRFLLPFTKQYNHVRELQRSGRVPKFGSFKYSARALFEKGVLVAYTGYSDRQYDKINITISSDEVGVFFIEGSMGSIQIPGASAQVPLDDLLQAQFERQQFMQMWDGGALRLNVNLFLHLVFRKFYRDE